MVSGGQSGGAYGKAVGIAEVDDMEDELATEDRHTWFENKGLFVGVMESSSNAKPVNVVFCIDLACEVLLCIVCTILPRDLLQISGDGTTWLSRIARIRDRIVDW